MTDDLVRTGDRVTGLTHRQRPAAEASIRVLLELSAWLAAELMLVSGFVGLSFFIYRGNRKYRPIRLAGD